MHELNALGNARLFAVARELEARGEPFAVATVVSRRPPVSARLGDKALIKADGSIVGWIGGSCAQPVVRREALAAIAAGAPRLVRLTTQDIGGLPAWEGVTHVAMTCASGGEAEIYIEPIQQRPTLVAVGDTPLVHALAQLAPVVGFAVTLVTEGPAASEGTETQVALAELRPERIRPGSFVVVATAGHYDEEALAKALASPARYIALVASRKRAATVMEFLRDRGLPDEALRRVKNPAGLDIKAATQEEIALSILAEMVQAYRTGMAAAEPLPMAAPVLAVDPVCGMEVEVASARHRHEHDGTTYYFCCPHCKARFAKDPARYLTAAEGVGTGA
jgi:xanthine dehydrogenase accessory factor